MPAIQDISAILEEPVKTLMIIFWGKKLDEKKYLMTKKNLDEKIWIKKWERLNGGTVPPFKMHPGGTVPPNKMHPEGLSLRIKCTLEGPYLHENVSKLW